MFTQSKISLFYYSKTLGERMAVVSFASSFCDIGDMTRESEKRRERDGQEKGS